MNEALLYLAAASQAYNSGQLSSAKSSAQNALAILKHMNHDFSSPSGNAYLNALTLLQSIASRQHDLALYESYEPSVKDVMLTYMGDFAASYYAVHLLDACECYLNAGDSAKAQQYLEDAISILTKENGTCGLFSFLHSYFNAKLHFHMEQYHECISDCVNANEFWMADALISEDATPFLQNYIQNEDLLCNMNYSNLILAGCAFGKINNPNEGLDILAELSKEPPADYYLRTSLDIILAELYVRAEKLQEAKAIYQKYRKQNLAQYSDLRASLATLSLSLEQSGSDIPMSFFAPEYDGQLSSSHCYSQDAFQIMLYNYGLTLIQKERYSEALSVFEQLGNKGLSLRLYLLAKLENYTVIPACKTLADQYYDCEIRSLFLYYNEKLVYNHLSLLEYHFSFCLDAYLKCYENLGREMMSPESIYDFVLNTKCISTEAAFLSHHYQTLESLNSRTPITSSDIMRQIGTDELLLEYSITRTPTETFYCVFLVHASGIDCIRLDSQQTIDALLLQWHSLLLRSTFAYSAELAMLNREMREVESKLRRMLYRPIKEYLDAFSDNRLIVSPAGALVQFPFSRLPMSASTYLGDCYEITYLNTAKELITNKSLINPTIDSALIVGDPILTNYAPLPYARMEVQNVAAQLGASCYIGDEATLDVFEPCLHSAPSLVHIATHGLFHQTANHSDTPDWNAAFETMEHSGLLLADNALLSCNLVSVMDFSNTALTVLSACETGKSIFHAAEGVYGLRRAFRLAGCHSMIVSLWQLDDRSGSFFMNAFYQKFTDSSCDAKGAFFYAIQALRSYEEDSICPFDHPYYWAGYIFIQ